MGKRFLAGAGMLGVTRATTSTPVSCFTTSQRNAVGNCHSGHVGSGQTLANYDYDSGTTGTPG